METEKNESDSSIRRHKMSGACSKGGGCVHQTNDTTSLKLCVLFFFCDSNSFRHEFDMYPCEIIHKHSNRKLKETCAHSIALKTHNRTIYSK